MRKPYSLVLLIFFSIAANIFAGPVKSKAFLDAIDTDDLETVKKLLADDPTLISIQDNRKKGSHGSALRLAILGGNADIAELLLSNGADPNEKYKNGLGPLHEAAKNGNADSIKALIKYGADINAGNIQSGHTPLCFATTRQATEALIAGGADISLRDKSLSRGTPLHSIAGSGLTEAAEVLLLHGAAIDARDSFGSTPLHRAASSGQSKMVELLVSKGADINAKNKKGLTPLNIAIDDDWGLKSKRKEVARVLLSHGAKYTIRDVVWLGDIKKVEKLLEGNPALVNDKSGMYKEAVIFAAIREGHGGVVKLLLDLGARLDVRDRYGTPPLHVAAYKGHRGVVETLLKGGADVNEKGAYGELALHWASVKGHLEVVEVLVDAGSQVNTKTEKQRIDMDTMMKETADVVKHQLKYLELHGKARQVALSGGGLQIAPPPRLAFAAGDSPLHSAAQWGHKQVVKLLLDKGAGIEIENNFGQRPLHYACVFRHEEIVRLLLDSGADVNAEDNDGNTPLALASFPKTNPVQNIVDLLRKRDAQ